MRRNTLASEKLLGNFDVITNAPFWKKDINDFLMSKGYSFSKIDPADHTLYRLLPDRYAFQYVNHKTSIRFVFIRELVYVFGWFDYGGDREETWYPIWQFSHPGTLENFKTILLVYLNSKL